MLSNDEENTALEGVLLHKSVARLSKEECAILGLVCCGYSMAETANLLGISRTWTGVRYRRILEALRKDLQDA